MDADVEARVRRSFARQGYMATIGAEVVHVADGEVDIAVPFSERLTQQDGYLTRAWSPGPWTARAATPRSRRWTLAQRC